MANKGQYYKIKTKAWLEKLGYQVAYLEQTRRLITRDKKTNDLKTIFIKQDQLGSDLFAVSEEWAILVQVKLGKKNVAEAAKEFEKYKTPSLVKKWIVVWQPKSREPEIIEV